LSIPELNPQIGNASCQEKNLINFHIRNNYCKFQTTMLISRIRELEKKLEEVTLIKESQDRELQMAKSMNAQSQPVHFLLLN